MDPVPGTPAFIPPTRGIKIVGISCNGTEFWGPQGTTAHTFLRSLRGKAACLCLGKVKHPTSGFPAKIVGQVTIPITWPPGAHHTTTTLPWWSTLLCTRQALSCRVTLVTQGVGGAAEGGGLLGKGG